VSRVPEVAANGANPTARQNAIAAGQSDLVSTQTVSAASSAARWQA
jgi:hypothetical protein